MAKKSASNVKGSFVHCDNNEFYKISNVQEMPPFFINLASNSDIWMFLSSNGSLTAGRKDASHALFPYETDDKIHLDAFTGPKTIVRVTQDSKISLWEPFDKAVVNPYKFTRNLYKNIWGNALIYEEINETLQISFQYKWENSEKFGIVRTSNISNLADTEREIAVLDGLQNIIPYGVAESLASCLADAYKHTELNTQTGMAIFSLNSKIVDMPEAVEILNANVAWSVPFAKSTLLLSTEQMKAFCNNEDLEDETLSLGRKCAYFMYQKFSLATNETADWAIILDVGLTQGEIAVLENKIQSTDRKDLLKEVKEDIVECTKQLQAIVAAADGMQCSNDSIASKHHFVNVLYNNMRGGIFDDAYNFDYEELIIFVKLRNKALLETQKDFFEAMKEHSNVIQLKEAAYKTGNADLIRISMEFLPICFSRRHGDPSRPWNKFFIDLKGANGKRLYHYEGNWRDIFQNWESMCLSFPEYIENVIAKFVNASTADGFNPYRINKEGIDWEIPEPHNPFSGLGYWGDHQIVYLTRLLEALNAHNPSAFEKLFSNDTFTYAKVPYRIKNFDSILKNSKETIEFDYDLHNSILEIAKQRGSDGRLILKNDSVYYVSFMEKLLVPILAKLSNLIVGGGIWMNTQRPEWNDANNAIVGNGLSMVTVYQLRRHLVFCKKLLSGFNGKTTEISNEVNTFFTQVMTVFEKYAENLNKEVDDKLKKEILVGLGTAFSEYREKLYSDGLSGKASVNYEDFSAFFQKALLYIDYSIEISESDGLYNAYNVVKFNRGEDSLTVSPLYPMLEGQTTALGSGKLSTENIISVIDTLEKSKLYSEEQNSFYLYPLKKLKTFMEKNIVPTKAVQSSELISALLKNNNTKFVMKDVNGDVRLNADITRFKAFVAVLEELKQDAAYAELVEKEYDNLCDCYEEVFKHREYTGRSGIMYKYEGIGCIYWHQNAKLLLSLGENVFYAKENGKTEEAVQLKEAYYRLRQGLGFCKEPSVWGAFPLDPYSHTAYLQGAQQPGMTGQVKEEILTRRLELGISIAEGKISFAPTLLRKSEFLETPSKLVYVDFNKKFSEIPLEKGSLAYTLCQTPVIYKLSSENKISFQLQNETFEIQSLTIDEKLSKKVFARDSDVKQIIVYIKESEIL